MRLENDSFKARQKAAEARAILASFFAELHRLDHPCQEWEGRIVCYVRAETEATVEQLLHELRQLETRLVLNMHKLNKSGFFQDSAFINLQDLAYQKWIHSLAEVMETELQVMLGKSDHAATEKGEAVVANCRPVFWPAVTEVQETAMENSREEKSEILA